MSLSTPARRSNNRDSKAIYNEIEPYAADWLENLVRANHIAAGRVERRPIQELTPDDVAGSGQRHFFAGIGVWSHALRLAGWPDDLDVWTGSCPCQPFSQAGRRSGTSDDRHLWPDWFRLIVACRPLVVLGEQVSSPDGLAWFDAVSSDLEGAGYAVGAIDTCAASVGAPHIRQRLYFAAVREDVLEHAGGAGGRRDAGAVPGAQGEGAGERQRAGRQPDLSLSRLNSSSSLSLSLSVAYDDDSRRGEQRSARVREVEVPPPGRDADRRSAPRLVADDDDDGSQAGDGRRAASRAVGSGSAPRLVADDDDERCDGTGNAGRGRSESSHDGNARVLADDDDDGRGPRRTGEADGDGQEQPAGRRADDRDLDAPDVDGATRGFWSGAEWVHCRDGKWRPVECRADGHPDEQAGPRAAQPGTEQVADGPAPWLERVRAAGPLVAWEEVPDPKPSRGGMLKGYGNAIVAPLAAEFVGAVMELLIGRE